MITIRSLSFHIDKKLVGPTNGLDLTDLKGGRVRVEISASGQYQTERKPSVVCSISMSRQCRDN